jgi:threonine efflux protein
MPFTLDLHILATFTLMWIVVVPTPGPNVLMVTHVAVTRTPAHVAYAIAGNMVGIALLAGLALIGWAAILEAFPWLRLGVSIFGGLYLMWLGARLLRKARRSGSAEAVPLSAAAGVPSAPGDVSGDYRRTALLGLVTALSNAQAILFITSFFAVAGVLNANAATGVATVIIILCCNASYLAALGWLFQREKMRAGYARYRGVLEGATGTLFMLFGGRLLWRALVR